MVSSLLVSVYFSSLVFFSFVNHPILYCLLLVSSAFSVAGYCYTLVGFSWYVVLFCLVYVGGIYILFIFVSVHNPNPNSVGGGSNWIFFLLLLSFYLLFFKFGGVVPTALESSQFLCSFLEGATYCFFCLVLLIGFVCVSVVVGDKDSFFR